VSTTADSLPNDLESLRALAAQVIAERDAAIAEREAAIKERDAERAEKAKLAAERDRLQGLYEHVHHLLRKANDHRFGARSERLDRLPADQLHSPSKTSKHRSRRPRRSRRRKSAGCHVRRRANAGHCPSICLASTRRWRRRAATARAARRRCI
jgi:hypothetical protein